MLETLVLAAALAAPTCVTAVPGALLDTADDPPAGAVGLVVPDAGPRTSERRAVESLLRGDVVNSLRDRLPSSPRLLERCPDSRWKVGVPTGGDQLNDRRYLLTLEGAQGLLTSTATRIPGLVAIADIAHGHVRVEEDDCEGRGEREHGRAQDLRACGHGGQLRLRWCWRRWFSRPRWRLRRA